MIKYAILIFAVSLVSSAQVATKWRLTTLHGAMPADFHGFLIYVLRLIKDPVMWTIGAAILISATLWYYSISRMQLGIAFGFAALSYPIVMLCSHLLLGENFNTFNYLGCGIIVIGVCMLAI